MEKIKIGDIVARKSYNRDILFAVIKILERTNGLQLVLLKGITIRILADSPTDDLEIISRRYIIDNIRLSNINLEKRIKDVRDKTSSTSKRQRIYTGKILHLDGDKKYSEKSQKYYNKLRIKCYC